MEIERKFLVKNDDWKSQIQTSENIIQFYLSDLTQTPTVRLRQLGDRGFLTLKYPSISADILIREEYEYEIPVQDVLAQRAAAKGRIITKTRYYIPTEEGHIWEVDVFDSPDKNLVLAEIELEAPDIKIICPGWIGQEVTKDKAYSNIRMAFSEL